MRWIFFPLLVLIILSVVSSYSLATKYANKAYDDALEETALAVVGQVERTETGWKSANPYLASLVQKSSDPTDLIYYYIEDDQHQQVSGDARIKNNSLTEAGPTYYKTTVDDVEFKAVALSIPTQYGPLYVYLGESTNDRIELTREVLLTTLSHQLALLVLMLIILWFSIGRGLIPLDNIRHALEERLTLKNPALLDVSRAPREIESLVTALNNAFSKVDRLLKLKRQFVADAAHQLRTPLSAASLQLELAERAINTASLHKSHTQIRIALDHAIELVQRLLILADVSAVDSSMASMSRVDIQSLLYHQLDQFDVIAQKKQIDLRFASMSGNPLFIRGNAMSLNELMNTLIDNAIKYTPAQGSVQVTLKQVHDQISITVEDSGSGIPEEQRTLVTNRFYRGHPQQVEGSGLGLAIALEVLNTHHGSMTIHTSPTLGGCMITVLLPTNLN